MADTTQITIVFADTNGPDKNEQSGYRIFRKLGSDPFPDNILVEDPLPDGVTIVKSDGKTKWTESSYDPSTDNNNVTSTGDITFTDNVEPGVSYFYRIEFYRNSTRESAISDAVGPLQGYTSSGLAYPGGALNYDPSDGIPWGNSYCSVAPMMHVDATFEYSKYGGDYSYSGAYLKNPYDTKSGWSEHNVEYSKSADQFENLVRDINLPLEAHYSQLVNWQTPLNGDGIPVIVQKFISSSSGTNAMNIAKRQTLTTFFNKYFNDKTTSDFIVNALPNLSPSIFLDKGFTAVIVVPGTRPFTKLDSFKIDAFESIQTWSAGTEYEQNTYVKHRDSDNIWTKWRKTANNNDPSLSPPENPSDWTVQSVTNPKFEDYRNTYIGNLEQDGYSNLIDFPLTAKFLTNVGNGSKQNQYQYYGAYERLPDGWRGLPEAFETRDDNQDGDFSPLTGYTLDEVMAARKRQIQDESKVFDYFNISNGERIKFRKNDHFLFNNLGVNGSLEPAGRTFRYSWDRWKDDRFEAIVGDFNTATRGNNNSTNALTNIRNEWHEGAPWYFQSFSYQKTGYFKDLIFKTDDDIEYYTKGPKELSVIGLSNSIYRGYKFNHLFHVGSGVGFFHYHNLCGPYISKTAQDSGMVSAFDRSSYFSHPMTGDQFTPAIWSFAGINPQGKFLPYPLSVDTYEDVVGYYPEDRQVGWSGAFPTSCGAHFANLNFVQDFWSDLDEETFTRITGLATKNHTGGSHNNYVFNGWKKYIAAIRDDALSLRNHKAYKYCKTSHIYVLTMRVNQDPDGGPNQFTAYLNGEPFFNFYDHYLGFPGQTNAISSRIHGINSLSAQIINYGNETGPGRMCFDKDNYPISCDSPYTYNSKIGDPYNRDVRGHLFETRHPIYLPGGIGYNLAASFSNPSRASGNSLLNLGFQPGGCRVTPGFTSPELLPFEAPSLGFTELLFFPELLSYADLKRVVGYLQTKYDGKLYPQQDLYHLGYTYQDNWSNNTAINNDIIYGALNDPFKLSKFQRTYTIQTTHSPEPGNFYGDGGPIDTTIGGWDFRFNDADPKPYPIKYIRGFDRNDPTKNSPRPIFY